MIIRVNQSINQLEIETGTGNVQLADEFELGGASVIPPRVSDGEGVDVLHEKTFVATEFGFFVSPTGVRSFQRRGIVGPAPRRRTGAGALRAEPKERRRAPRRRAHGFVQMTPFSVDAGI